jgi:hypothetical protein
LKASDDAVVDWLSVFMAGRPLLAAVVFMIFGTVPFYAYSAYTVLPVFERGGSLIDYEMLQLSCHVRFNLA